MSAELRLTEPGRPQRLQCRFATVPASIGTPRSTLVSIDAPHRSGTACFSRSIFNGFRRQQRRSFIQLETAVSWNGRRFPVDVRLARGQAPRVREACDTMPVMREPRRWTCGPASTPPSRARGREGRLLLISATAAASRVLDPHLWARLLGGERRYRDGRAYSKVSSPGVTTASRSLKSEGVFACYVEERSI